jgi:hypothetical protein
MGSAIFELILFSLPSLLYARRLRRSGADRLEARKVVGLQPGRRTDYLLAVVITPLGIALALFLLNLIPTQVLHGGSKNIVGAPDTAGGYAAIVLLGRGRLIWPQCGRLIWPHFRPIARRPSTLYRALKGVRGEDAIESGAVRADPQGPRVRGHVNACVGSEVRGA